MIFLQQKNDNHDSRVFMEFGSFALNYILRRGLDFVPSILCSVWPNAVAEWITGKRLYNGSSINLIDNTAKAGCHFVAQSKDSVRDVSSNEFTFSFSKPEDMLYNDLSKTKTNIYKFRRQIVQYAESQRTTCDDANKARMCSCCVKTFVFWSCEDRPPEIWTKERLSASLSEILCRFIEWKINKT